MIEDGATFEANALKKARTLAEFSGLLTLADDSGLEVDALNGAPGIYSARYAGERGQRRPEQSKAAARIRKCSGGKTYGALCLRPGAVRAQIYGALKNGPCANPAKGGSLHALTGSNGFGYDPLFFYPPFNKTFGEIEREIKATVSHRGKALQNWPRHCRRLIDLHAKP